MSAVADPEIARLLTVAALVNDATIEADGNAFRGQGDHGSPCSLLR